MFPRFPFIALGCLFVLPTLGASLETTWEGGLHAFQRGEFERAAELFERWTFVSAAQGKRSSEAFFNLGLSQLKAEHSDFAAFAFVHSMGIGSHPLRNARIIPILAQIQDSLGFKENVPSRSDFILWAEIKKEAAFSLIVVGALLLQIWVLFYVFLKRRYYAIKLLGWIPASLIALGLLFFGATFFTPRIGIVLTSKKETFLYPNPAMEAEQKIVEVPSGTLFIVDDSRENAIRMSFPLAGWVNKESVQGINVTL